MAKFKKLSEKVKLIGIAPGTKEYRNLARKVNRMQKRGYIFSPTIEVGPATNLYSVSVYVDPQTGALIKGTTRFQQEKSNWARQSWETRRRNAKLSEQEMVHIAPELDKVLTEIWRKINSWEAKDVWKRDKNKTPKGGTRKYETFDEVKERDKNKLKAYLNYAIATEGKEAVAARMEANAEMVNYYAEMILYGSSGDSKDGGDYMQGALAEFAELITGRQLTDGERQDLEYQIESFFPA